jgi:DNA primase
MGTIDFAKIKQAVSIEQVAQMLGLKLTQSRDQLRGPCPITKSPDPRAFVITPSKGVYYSFKEGKGGDALTLFSKVRGCTVREAAEAIAAHFGAEKVNAPPQPSQEKEKRAGFDAARYAAGLDAAHAALEPLALSEDTLKAWKAGYAPSGVLRGKLALPVALSDGTVVAYVGRAVNDEPPLFTFTKEFDPKAYLFGADRVKEGELMLMRDPLDVLRAYEGGVENCVAFLTDGVGIPQLEVLIGLMHEKRCESVSLF